MSRALAEILAKDRIITAQQFQECQAAAQTGKSHIRYLLDKKYVAENKLLYFLSQKFNLSSVNLSKFEVSPDVIKLVPAELAKKYQLIPIQANKGTLVVAVCDPTNISALDDLKFRTRLNVEPVLTSYSVFDQAMAKYYSGVAAAASAIENFRTAQQKEDESGAGIGIEIATAHQLDGDANENDAPIIKLVNSLFAECIRRAASDIHIEPYEKRFRVRLRIDGTLVEITEIPHEMRRAVVARFKVMARLDTTENRVPQDGRIKLKTTAGEVDFRVNTMPTLFGEKIVLRMLSQGNISLVLDKMGFNPDQMKSFRKGIYSANGMVLVTGPTGSGKTTTLYAALKELNQISDNLSTAEDPVEYNLEGINQCQVNKEVGLTFAAVLRSLLRQDPDTILVGEIRDYETAEVAIQAALTGHLVLSTLHTNDAASTITRLLNMGVEPFLVVASLNTIVAQRLLRTVCSACKTEASIPKEKLIELGIKPEVAAQMKTYKGRGCQVCTGTGYKGRAAIYEILDFSNNLKEMVLKGETAFAIKKAAINEGMITLRQSALTKVIEGKTSLEEALSMTMEG